MEFLEKHKELGWKGEYTIPEEEERCETEDSVLGESCASIDAWDVLTTRGKANGVAGASAGTGAGGTVFSRGGDPEARLRGAYSGDDVWRPAGLVDAAVGGRQQDKYPTAAASTPRPLQLASAYSFEHDAAPWRPRDDSAEGSIRTPQVFGYREAAATAARRQGRGWREAGGANPGSDAGGTSADARWVPGPFEAQTRAASPFVTESPIVALPIATASPAERHPARMQRFGNRLDVPYQPYQPYRHVVPSELNTRAEMLGSSHDFEGDVSFSNDHGQTTQTGGERTGSPDRFRNRVFQEPAGNGEWRSVAGAAVAVGGGGGDSEKPDVDVTTVPAEDIPSDFVSHVAAAETSALAAPPFMSSSLQEGADAVLPASVAQPWLNEHSRGGSPLLGEELSPQRAEVSAAPCLSVGAAEASPEGQALAGVDMDKWACGHHPVFPPSASTNATTTLDEKQKNGIGDPSNVSGDLRKGSNGDAGGGVFGEGEGTVVLDLLRSSSSPERGQKQLVSSFEPTSPEFCAYVENAAPTALQQEQGISHRQQGMLETGGAREAQGASPMRRVGGGDGGGGGVGEVEESAVPDGGDGDRNDNCSSADGDGNDDEATRSSFCSSAAAADVACPLVIAEAGSKTASESPPPPPVPPPASS